MGMGVGGRRRQASVEVNNLGTQILPPSPHPYNASVISFRSPESPGTVSKRGNGQFGGWQRERVASLGGQPCELRDVLSPLIASHGDGIGFLLGGIGMFCKEKGWIVRDGNSPEVDCIPRWIVGPAALLQSFKPDRRCREQPVVRIVY